MNKIERIFKKLEKEYLDKKAMAEEVFETANTLQILIAIILSARTKDETTKKILPKLFKKVKKTKDLKKLSRQEIEKLVYPVGFFKRKAGYLKKLGSVLENKKIEEMNFEEITKLPGVGRKTANLFLSLVKKEDRITVDTHVHRISNRLGFVKTKNVLETEKELEKILPKEFWRKINYYFVLHGQNICKPLKPLCDKCPIKKDCFYFKSKN